MINEKAVIKKIFIIKKFINISKNQEYENKVSIY